MEYKAISSTPPPRCVKSTHFQAHSCALASRRSFQHVPDSSSHIILPLLLLASLYLDKSAKTNRGREQQRGRRRLVCHSGVTQWATGVKVAQDVAAGGPPGPPHAWTLHAGTPSTSARPLARTPLRRLHNHTHLPEVAGVVVSVPGSGLHACRRRAALGVRVLLSRGVEDAAPLPRSPPSLSPTMRRPVCGQAGCTNGERIHQLAHSPPPPPKMRSRMRALLDTLHVVPHKHASPAWAVLEMV
jgi:hypothetical protein